MKNLVLAALVGMGLSASAMAADAESLWVESIFCGEIDPMIVGDACLIELMNDGYHIAILVNYDQFLADFSTDVTDYGDAGIAVYLDKLKKAPKKVEKVIREDMGLQNDVALYVIDIKYIYTYPTDGELEE